MGALDVGHGAEKGCYVSDATRYVLFYEAGDNFPEGASTLNSAVVMMSSSILRRAPADALPTIIASKARESVSLLSVATMASMTIVHPLSVSRSMAPMAPPKIVIQGSSGLGALRGPMTMGIKM
jgi:hypothetical protein